jgi:pimeloyl-ACP methyl ester carboxylesterase
MQVVKEPPLESSTLSIDGIATEIWAGGEGRPIVFLHPGDGLDATSPFLESLAARYRVIAPSHPGFGRSELPVSLTTVDDLSYFYLDFFEQENLRDAVLLGVSFGAWIAAEIAVKNTSRLAGVILSDAVGAKFGGVMTRDIADLFSIPQYEQARHLYSAADRQKQSYAHLDDEVLARMARNHESFALFGWSPTLHNPKLAQRLHRINVPTEIIWGADDKVVSPEYGKIFASKIPGASFTLIKDAGHYPQIEQPHLFAQAVTRFIDTLPTR